MAAISSLAAPDRSELNARATQQAGDLVAQMTLDEKINLIEMENLPIERLNIPGHHWWSEALHGVARRGEATQFPVPLSMACTTPIPEGEAGRVPGDELKYNKTAEENMKKHGIAIDDLYTVAAKFDPALYEGPGNVHFLKEGSELLAQQVAASIKAHLPKK